MAGREKTSREQRDRKTDKKWKQRGRETESQSETFREMNRGKKRQITERKGTVQDP